jgi:mono/diheme cytochrome c family protein
MAALAIAAAAALAACAGHGGGGDPVATGDALFHGAGTCATCHGGDLQGTSMGPSLLESRYEADVLPDDAIRSAVREGVLTQSRGLGVMPALPHLDDGDIDAIIAFVRSRQEGSVL